ncbi:2-isopropylmalate synthase [Candidatus Magnetomonas plexicatena]|uniref:2-isopropylmalate synthase n=1 Tax=Candidatus Magnetomonas plexicatena TaxID=2552947 RepID=UPI001C78E24E|nr:2-isopropylmalate synthase [Nitrospirales bacterium LBB_01]
MQVEKYRPYKAVSLEERLWPSRVLEKAPVWCAVDLRDGNQALPSPMEIDAKLVMFKLLTEIGFKEIEISFPSASKVDFEFTRCLIENSLIPDDVTIQVITQARVHLINKTFEAIEGAKRVNVHLYNSTSELQRRVVFKKSKAEIIALAAEGAECIKNETLKHRDTEFVLEYSPESFTATEPEFALEICMAVMDVWRPDVKSKMIINLPSTVEHSSPNVYADTIEWFIKNMGRAKVEKSIISVHTHNDRGTAVAATELALLAGAERVEGTLFGNGERTGNVDIITVALNMFTQGVNPHIYIGDINRIVETYERCTGMNVHSRHPYAGGLVFTAFSGSHQDAIKKGMRAMKESNSQFWEVPYIPIDPSDIGKTYESIIRINSQSGKGGIAYIMEEEFGFKIPKEMQPEFAAIIQKISEETGKEINAGAVWDSFKKHYLNVTSPIELINCNITESQVDDNGSVTVDANVKVSDKQAHISGSGNGPVDAFCNAIRREMSTEFSLISYHEHSLEIGSTSRAAAYIQLEDNKGRQTFGVGVDSNISIASIKAVISGLNKLTSSSVHSGKVLCYTD